jgi:acetyl-CoA carboxylase carboxyltransferase component
VVKPKGRNAVWGVIYSDSADKATVLLPIAIRKNPLVLFRCHWFMVGSKSEQGGIIKMAQNGKR